MLDQAKQLPPENLCQLPLPGELLYFFDGMSSVANSKKQISELCIVYNRGVVLRGPEGVPTYCSLCWTAATPCHRGRSRLRAHPCRPSMQNRHGRGPVRDRRAVAAHATAGCRSSRAPPWRRGRPGWCQHRRQPASASACPPRPASCSSRLASRFRRWATEGSSWMTCCSGPRLRRRPVQSWQQTAGGESAWLKSLVVASSETNETTLMEFRPSLRPYSRTDAAIACRSTTGRAPKREIAAAAARLPNRPHACSPRPAACAARNPAA